MPISVRRIVSALGCFAVIVSVLAAKTSAHEGLHAQIQRASDRIRQEPDHAEHYLKRGELHRLHEDWAAALADLERAEALDPAGMGIAFARARVLLQCGQPAQALRIVESICLSHPTDGRSQLTRARALAELGRFRDSANAYALAVHYLRSPGSDIYLEWARAEASIGDQPLARAIQVLDQGITTLGPVASLHRLAIDLELRIDRHDTALARVDELLRRSRRRDQWLALKGDVLENAQRFDDAIEAYREALRAIESLPHRLRSVPSTRDRAYAVRRAMVEIEMRGQAAPQGMGLNGERAR